MLRQHSRRLAHKTNGISKVLCYLKAQVILAIAYYKLVLTPCLLKIKDKDERTSAWRLYS